MATYVKCQQTLIYRQINSSPTKTTCTQQPLLINLRPKPGTAFQNLREPSLRSFKTRRGMDSSSKCNTLPVHLYCLKTKGLMLLTVAKVAKPRHIGRLPLIPAEVSIKLKKAMEVHCCKQCCTSNLNPPGILSLLI